MIILQIDQLTLIILQIDQLTLIILQIDQLTLIILQIDQLTLIILQIDQLTLIILQIISSNTCTKYGPSTNPLINPCRGPGQGFIISNSFLSVLLPFQEPYVQF